MNRYQTVGLILRRVNYGEADRIVTLITKDHGRISALAKGVRKPQSKLAGGLELFSLSDITVLKGKGDLDHIISTRLKTHFSHVIEDYERVQLGYLANETVYKRTQVGAEGDVFEILLTTYEALNDLSIPLSVIEAWFTMRMLHVHGHQPNLTHDSEGEKLRDGEVYSFDMSLGSFSPSKHGQFETNDLKAWRLLLERTPKQLAQVAGIEDSLKKTGPLLGKFLTYTS